MQQYLFTLGFIAIVKKRDEKRFPILQFFEANREVANLTVRKKHLPLYEFV